MAAETREPLTHINVKVPASVLDEVRQEAAEAGYPDVPLSALVRAGLLLLAGYPIAEAWRRATAPKPGGSRPSRQQGREETTP